MAVYHLHVSSGTKGSGKGGGGHARYLLREGPYAKGMEPVSDGATIQMMEIDKAAELVYYESGNMPIWTTENPVEFWDAADEFERANGCTYREVEVALPEELSLVDQKELARAFAMEIAKVSEGVTPWTLAIHSQDQEHPGRRHAHIMLSDRVFDGQDRTPATFFRQPNAKVPGARKTEDRRAKPGVNWTDRIRPLWQEMANRALESAGLDVRIDHRSLEVQREDVEKQAAREKGPYKRAMLEYQAASLDRPAQPKKGRVLTHAGPEKAPDRAALFIAYEQAKAEREAAREARRAAEREAERVTEELTRTQRILTAQQQRQERRDAKAIQTRWNIRRDDRDTAAEQRPGIRHPQREQWVAWRRKRLTEEYGKDLAEKLAPWVRVQRANGHLLLTNREIDVLDRGDRVVARKGGTDREIQVLLEVAKAKGWSTLSLTGSPEFQAKMARVALSQGFALADKDLEDRTLTAMEKEAAERARKEAEQKRIEAEREAAKAEAMLADFAKMESEIAATLFAPDKKPAKREKQQPAPPAPKQPKMSEQQRTAQQREVQSPTQPMPQQQRDIQPQPQKPATQPRPQQRPSPAQWFASLPEQQQISRIQGTYIGRSPSFHLLWVQNEAPRQIKRVPVGMYPALDRGNASVGCKVDVTPEELVVQPIDGRAVLEFDRQIAPEMHPEIVPTFRDAIVQSLREVQARQQQNLQQPPWPPTMPAPEQQPIQQPVPQQQRDTQQPQRPRPSRPTPARQPQPDPVQAWMDARPEHPKGHPVYGLYLGKTPGGTHVVREMTGNGYQVFLVPPGDCPALDRGDIPVGADVKASGSKLMGVSVSRGTLQYFDTYVKNEIPEPIREPLRQQIAQTIQTRQDLQIQRGPKGPGGMG